MFRLPPEGYEDPLLAQILDDYLFPKRSVIHTMAAKHDLLLKGVSCGDAMTIELGRVRIIGLSS